MKVTNWIIDHVYWLFSIVFLVISAVSFFVEGDMVTATFAYIGFFGCLNLHGISKIESQFEETFIKSELEYFDFDGFEENK